MNLCSMLNNIELGHAQTCLEELMRQFFFFILDYLTKSRNGD